MALEICWVLCFKYPGSRSVDYDSLHFTIIQAQAGSVYKLCQCAMIQTTKSWWIIKGGSKVSKPSKEEFCNSAPNGPNDLEFCMWGTLGRYIWFLCKSRSHDLYIGQTCSGLQMWLTSIGVTWHWLGQKSNVAPQSSSHAKFYVIWSMRGWVCSIVCIFKFIIALCWNLRFKNIDQKSK